MVQTSPKTLTLEEFLQLPETKPASEYIDGLIIQKPMPQGKHSRIQGQIVTAINAIILNSKKIACAFPELRCTFGGRSIVPDVSVFLWDRITQDEKGEVANIFSISPDWTMEIWTPDQSYTKVTKNIRHCLKFETQMGWLVDIEDRSVLVYPAKQGPEVFDEPEAQLPVPSFASDLQLTVGDLFAWLKK